MVPLSQREFLPTSDERNGLNSRAPLHFQSVHLRRPVYQRGQSPGQHHDSADPENNLKLTMKDGTAYTHTLRTWIHHAG